MKLLDVNILVSAYRSDHANYPITAPWLKALLESNEPFGMPKVVQWSFLRITTHPRIYSIPTPPDKAMEFINILGSEPGHIAMEAGPFHMEHLTRLCQESDVSGDLFPDAILAAIAVEHGAEVISFDRDFARFPGVRWSKPTI
ncbi:MAG: type II toxin-antitoxin system VapC family toxin [Candidatus Dormibacteraceae bacterium]